MNETAEGPAPVSASPPSDDSATASPLGKSRYGRTRKPKISEDFCNIDDLFGEAAPRPQRSPQKAKKQAAKPLEIDSLFMPKQIQPLPKQATPQRAPGEAAGKPKIIGVPLKERKFFKKDAGEGGEAEGPIDVSEVLKIIKSDPGESAVDAPKPASKQNLRTYGNKRKLLGKNEVVESFALPDSPIIPLQTNVPAVLDKKLDVAPPSSTESVNVISKQTPETNNIDLQESDVSSCTLNLNNYGVYDEIQIKAEECMVKNQSMKKVSIGETANSVVKTDGSMNNEVASNAQGSSEDRKIVVEKKKEAVNGVKEKRKRKNRREKTRSARETKSSSKKSKARKKRRNKHQALVVENKIIEILESENVELKSVAPLESSAKKRKREKTRSETSSPRILRSSVIAVEPKPPDVVDLTEDDEEEAEKPRSENSSPRLLRSSSAAKVQGLEKSRSESLSSRVLRSSMANAESKETVDLTEECGKAESCAGVDEPKKNIEREEEIVPECVEERQSSENLVEEGDIKKEKEENCDVKIKEEKEEEVDKETLKVEIKKEPLDYEVGDLLWARIGGHPFWPCIISLEPDRNDFKRARIFGRNGKACMYHVRFYGDNGRRAWVNSANIFPFTGENDLERLSKTCKPPNKHMYVVPSSKRRKWKIATEEAASMLAKTVQQRFDFFFEMFASAAERKQKIMGIAEKAKTRIRIKQEDQTVPVPGRRGSKRRSTSSPPTAEKKRPAPGPDEDEEKNGRAKLRSEAAASECSLSDTDTSSKLSVNSTNSLEAQAALYKRNNIFRGAHKGRVCQICEGQKEVLKCKSCFGYFHVACVDQETKSHVEAVCTEEEVGGKEEGKCEEDVVAVDSSSRASGASSPGKVDFKSVDFKKLSLAEQIDLKMKEIMKKFDYKTIYADSTSDSTASDESIPEKPTKLETGGEELHKTSATEKRIQHVTADCITFANSEDEASKPPEDPPTKQDELLAARARLLGADAAPVSSSEDAQGKRDFKCVQCLSGLRPPCFVCGGSEDGPGARRKCSLHHCGKFYHPECLRLWPQTKSSVHDSFICPLHVCHTCVSDNPKAACCRSTDNLVRCVRCPSTYHSSSYCIPAGTIILSTKQVVCVRHVRSSKYNKTLNTTWCFLCSLGGDLICCETCPTSVHPKCLKINLTDIDRYICDDCESGRYPLYDEIVWVKMGTYRWWPALILFPNEIPDNVNSLPHTQGEFVVKFYGTHNHHWVSRGRVFLFQEGDEEQLGQSKKKMDVIFRKAVEEAIAAFQLKKSFKTAKAAEMNTNKKPPAYIRIKSNKPVGNVRQFDGNTSNTTACECDPGGPFPCGPDSDCLNRLLLTECDPTICPAGDRCNNQRFEKREYPPMAPYKTEGRGWGLKTLAPISKGQFVVEYVGELIDEQEYQRRVQKMHEQKEENYYFLTIDNYRMIDAGPKGNVARFMNHSCRPNCETQKWTVNGGTRVGLFAKEDIPAGAELTFNYNLECIGKEKKICRCGAPNCSGFIGVKAKTSVQEEIQKKPKRPVRRKKASPTPVEAANTENVCFICSEAGEVMSCHNKICNKFYHLKCVDLAVWPEGKWVCPWHNCNICSKRTIRCCVKCLNSFCPAHSEGNVRHDKLLGFVCFEHDPSKEFPEVPPADANFPKPVDASANTSHQTEETDITSTTSDEVNVPKEKQAGGGGADPGRDGEEEFKELPSSTPRKKRRESADTDGEIPPTKVVVVEKRKRGRPPKRTRKAKQEAKTAVVESPKSLVDNAVTIQNEVKLTSTVPTRHLRAAKRTAESNRTEFERFLKRQLDFENNLPIRKRSRARCETNL